MLNVSAWYSRPTIQMRLDLNGSTILVAANQLHPFIYANYGPNSTELESLEGYEGVIIQMLSKFLNFSIKMVDCDMQWGAKQPDGSWDGLVGAVYEKRANLAIGAITITNERSEAVQFSYPHYINSVTFTTAVPQRSGHSSSLLGPFEDLVWLFLFAFLLIVFFIDLNLNKNIQKSSQISWSVISIILCKDIPSFRSKLFSLRLLISSWLLAAFVLQNYYCGQLFRLMTFSGELKKIESIPDFAKVLSEGKVKVVSDDNGEIYMSKFQGIDLTGKAGLKYKKIVDDFDEMVKTLKDDPHHYSAIMERMYLEYVLSLNDVDQYLPPTYKESNFFLDTHAVILEKESFLEYEVNRHLSYIKESGLIDYWNEQFFMKKFKRFHSIDSFDTLEEFVELNLDQLMYAFKTAFYGISASIVVMIAENLYNNWIIGPNKRHNRHKNQSFHYSQYFSNHRKWDVIRDRYLGYSRNASLKFKLIKDLTFEPNY